MDTINLILETGSNEKFWLGLTGIMMLFGLAVGMTRFMKVMITGKDFKFFEKKG